MLSMSFSMLVHNEALRAAVLPGAGMEVRPVPGNNFFFQHAVMQLDRSLNIQTYSHKLIKNIHVHERTEKMHTDKQINTQ